MKQHGFVYLLGNEWMPDLYKIGCTERAPHARAAQLSEPTGVPAPFKVLCYIEVEDHQAVEREFHRAFEWARISNGREFFYTEDLDQLVGAFRLFSGALAFSYCGAKEWYSANSGALTGTEGSDYDDDMPWDTPALKVVEGGKGA